MGSALLLMVVRFSRGKKANAAREAELTSVEADLSALHAAILPLAERDAQGFEPVAAAYGLPRATPAEQAAREAAIRAGLVEAMVVPFESLRLIQRALATVLPVADCANRSIVSDLAAGATLLRAAAEIALLNLRINVSLAGEGDDVLASARSMREDVVRQHAALCAAADRLLAPG